MFLTGSAPNLSQDRRRILIAAASVLERTSYRSLKIRQVLATADVATSTFYRHFGGKTDLMLALIREEAAVRIADLHEELEAAGSPREQLVAWIDHSVRIVFDPVVYGHAKVFVDPLLMDQVPTELAAVTEMLIEPLQAIIERGAVTGDLTSPDPARDARALYHVVRGELTDVLIGARKVDPAAMREALVGFTFQALGAETRNPVPAG